MKKKLRGDFFIRSNILKSHLWGTIMILFLSKSIQHRIKLQWPEYLIKRGFTPDFTHVLFNMVLGIIVQYLIIFLLLCIGV